MKLNNEKGIALIMSLFITSILMAYGSIFVLRTVHDSRIAERERDLMKAFYVAEGSSQAGLKEIDTLINTHMNNTFASWSPSAIVNNVNNFLNQADPDGIGFLAFSVQDGGTQVMTINGANAEYTLPSSVTLGEGSYTYAIEISEKTNPFCVGAFPCDVWDFPYDFRVIADGTAFGQGKNVLVTGDFVIRVQRDNFAKYALFTNEQQLPSGTNVWFTDNTNFAGPVHTNGRFNIYGNPSGTFDGYVSQYETTTRYYNSGSTVLLNDDHNGVKDVPIFNAGFERGADFVTLGSPTQESDMIAQALGGSSSSGNGIYVPNDGTSLTGGIYVEGDGTIDMSVDVSNNAVYTITQGALTRVITVDQVNNTTEVYYPELSGSTTFTGAPDGMEDVGTLIYVKGDIDSIGGTVQHATEVTIASESNVNIDDHIVYENYTAAVGTPGTAGYVPPNATGQTNLLGIVAWGGDVTIGATAPNDVNIHGTLLSKAGMFTVTNYNSGSPKGTATLLGGVIQDNYGAFGQFSGSTGAQLHGYGRNFVYDERMEVGVAPPYFPSLDAFIAFTNDITDKMVWQEGDS